MIQSPRRTVLAGLIGNVMEWFDFAVYGYFASVIGGQFFPESSPAAQQLLSFTVFALGFGARPIGSLVLGAVIASGGAPCWCGRSPSWVERRC
jgi:MFS transporter, MHS family, proline/betaine transporter